MKILVWSFIAYGLTSILVWGSIFDKPRQWIIRKSRFFGELIQCVLCTSTWVGFLLSILFGGLSNKYFEIPQVVSIIIDGFFTAGVVWAINSIIEFFEENRISK